MGKGGNYTQQASQHMPQSGPYPADVGGPHGVSDNLLIGKVLVLAIT